MQKPNEAPLGNRFLALDLNAAVTISKKRRQTTRNRMSTVNDWKSEFVCYNYRDV